jgi:hypothetical protein
MWRVFVILYTAVKETIKFLVRLFDALMQTEEVKEFTQAIADLYDAVTELFGAVWELIEEGLKALFGEMGKTDKVITFRDLIRGVVKLFTMWVKWITFCIRQLTSLFDLVAKNKTFKAFWESIGEAIDATLDKLGKFGRAMMAFLDGEPGKAYEILTGADEMGKASGTGDTDWNKRVVYERLKEAGYNDDAIAGIMGRVQQEHNFDTSDVPEHWATDANGNRVWVGGYGMFQWNGGRTTAFLKWAKENGLNPQDPGVQTDYAIIEARQRGLDPSVMNQMSVHQAARVWTRKWEVGNPGDEERYADDIRRDITHGAPWLQAKAQKGADEEVTVNGGLSDAGENLGRAGRLGRIGAFGRRLASSIPSPNMSLVQPMTAGYRDYRDYMTLTSGGGFGGGNVNVEVGDIIINGANKTNGDIGREVADSVAKRAKFYLNNVGTAGAGTLV